MKRWLVIFLWFLAVHAQAVQVTDDRGVAVDLPRPDLPISVTKRLSDPSPRQVRNRSDGLTMADSRANAV